MKLRTLKPRIQMLPDRIKTLRTPRVRPHHASQDQTAQARPTVTQAGPREMPGADPIVKVGSMAAPAKAGPQ